MKIAANAIFAAAAMLLAGCAGQHSTALLPSSAATQNPSSAATMASDSRAFLTLDQIEPKVVLPTTAPTTSPAQDTPLEAIQLYAQARDAFDEGGFNAAIAMLQHAARVDPQSAEIQRFLGETCMLEPLQRDNALPAYERAAELDPDNLQVQIEIARQYMHRNDAARVFDRLRLARLTSGYQTDAEGAAIVDFFLAQALKQAGYDRAALDQYASLLQRLTHPDASIQRNAELMFMTNRPDLIYVAVGELYEKHAQYDQALHAYQLADDRHAEDEYESQGRVIRVLAESGKIDDARQRAAQLLVKRHADDVSLALLKSLYGLGGGGKFIDALAQLHAKSPADLSLTTALADEYHADHQDDLAIKLLLETLQANSSPDIVRQLFSLYLSSGDMDSAVRLLVESLADKPDAMPDFDSLYSQLLRTSGRNRLRMASLQNLAVRPGAESARLFLISRVANLWTRDALARSSIEQSAGIVPPFAPAYRALIQQYANRPDWDEQQRNDAMQLVIARAAAQGNPALAAELRGRALQMQDHLTDALAAYDEAEKKGDKAPEFRLIHAEALVAGGDVPRASEILWALISDWPTYDSAYAELIDLYASRQDTSAVKKVLRHWTDADRDSVTAQIYVAADNRQDDPQASETILLGVFHKHPEDMEAIEALQNFYASSQQIEKFIALLDDERKEHPDNRAVVGRLIDLYHLQDRVPDAVRLIEATRQAVAKDPEMLYYVASLYSEIDQMQQSEEVLEQVIALDPGNASASNDLGYYWADSNKNLAEAEKLVRIAVTEEPDNQSYLDSLAWTLYKRGKFDEARTYLDRAIGPASRPDPVVLDHLGDVMYRQSKNAEALKTWKWSLKRIDDMGDDMRDELKRLQVVLKKKIDDGEAGRSIHVAPTAAESEHADSR